MYSVDAKAAVQFSIAGMQRRSMALLRKHRHCRS